MLQSEFFERTKVSLTADEYGLVEEIYNAIKMNKDEFCKWWLENRNNKLYQELADAYLLEASRHRADVTCMTRANEEIHNEFEEYKKQKAEEIDRIVNAHNNAHNDFAARIIRTQCDDPKVYDVIEEEFTIGFIIKTKREAGIALTDEEIDYMVGKL